MSFRSYNRFTKQLIASQTFENTKSVQEKLSDLSNINTNWKTVSLKDRRPVIEEISNQVKRNRSNLTELLVLETGIPTKMAKKEVQMVIDYSEYVLQKYSEHLAPINVNTNATKKSLITFNPLGVIYCICGNEAPLWQMFKLLLPNIAAGNSVLIRPPSESLSIARGIEEMLKNAEIENVKFVYGDPKDYENIFSSAELRGVAYSGSFDEAKRIGGLAGKYIKPSVIELDTKSVMVVLQNGDVSKACEHWHNSKLIRQV